MTGAREKNSEPDIWRAAELVIEHCGKDTATQAAMWAHAAHCMSSSVPRAFKLGYLSQNIRLS